MKKIFFSFAITCFVQITFGQKISYLENNPVWNVVHSRVPCFEYGETNYYLSGDTSITYLGFDK